VHRIPKTVRIDPRRKLLTRENIRAPLDVVTTTNGIFSSPSFPRVRHSASTFRRFGLSQVLGIDLLSEPTFSLEVR